MEEAIAAKTFREDLYYRLNVLTVNVPPLRARGQDVSLLANAFIEKYNLSKGRTIGISNEAMSLILSYSWPGNIRELENAIERAVNIAPDDMIRPEHLPPTLSEQKSSMLSQASHSTLTPETILYPAQGFIRSTPMSGTAGTPSEEIVYTLQRCGGNVTEAAKKLGISRRTLYRKMDKYCIDYEQFRMG